MKKWLIMFIVTALSQQSWGLVLESDSDEISFSSMSQAEMINRINQPGFDVNILDDRGVSILEHAAQRNFVEAIKHLIARGVNIADGRSLCRASDHCSVEAMKIFLDHGVPVDTTGWYGMTSLFCVVSQCNCKLLKDDKKLFEQQRLRAATLLLQYGADCNLENNKFEHPTPLFAAACLRSPAIARILIAHGARSSTTRRADGKTAAQCATYLDTATFLRNWQNFQQRPKFGKKPQQEIWQEFEKKFPAREEDYSLMESDDK